MPKNAQTTAQLHSSHTLVKGCSKFSKPGFSNTWTVNFLMFKLVLEKAEEPEIKLPTSAQSSKKQESSRKTSISALSTMPKPWLCGSQQTTPVEVIPVELSQILKRMLLKCCTQHASKFGKLSSGYRTGKGQFSFQSQRKAMPRMLKLLHNCTHPTR